MPHYQAIADDWSDSEDEVEESGNERDEQLGNEVVDERDHRVEAELDQEIAETPQQEVLGKSSQVAGADNGEDLHQINDYPEEDNSRIAEEPTPARDHEVELGPGQQGTEMSQQEVARANNVEDAPQISGSHGQASNTISEEPTPSKSPSTSMRVSKDAWSWSDSDSEDEASQTIVPRQPPPILLSSDSDVTEPTSSRKRKRTATVRMHEFASKQPKRTHPSPRRGSSSLVSSDLVVTDQDPLLHAHLPSLLPPHLLSVGSVRFGGSKQGPRMKRSSNRQDGTQQQPSASQDDTPGVVPPVATSTTRNAKGPLSMKPSALSARLHRERKNPISKQFHRRYLTDRAATLTMVNNLQKDSRWTHMSEEERNAIRAAKTQELMEQRFAEGRSQSSFLSQLLQLISQRGYSEGVVLRLLLQTQSVQAVLGQLLEDVVDIDEAGNFFFK